MKKVLGIIFSLILLLSMTGCRNIKTAENFRFHLTNAGLNGLKFEVEAAKNGEIEYAYASEKITKDELAQKRSFIVDGKEYEAELRSASIGKGLDTTLHPSYEATYQNEFFSAVIDVENGDLLELETRANSGIYEKAVNVSDEKAFRTDVEKFFFSQFGKRLRYNETKYTTILYDENGERHVENKLVSGGSMYIIEFALKNSEGIPRGKAGKLWVTADGTVQHIEMPYFNKNVEKVLSELKIDVDELNRQCDAFCSTIPIQKEYSHLQYRCIDKITAEEIKVCIDANGEVYLSATVDVNFDGDELDCTQHFWVEIEIIFD